MILSIYLLACIAFLGLPFGFVSALVATAMVDFLIVGFVVERWREWQSKLSYVITGLKRLRSG